MYFEYEFISCTDFTVSFALLCPAPIGNESADN